MISEANPVIQEAYHKLEILIQNPDNRRKYEAREVFLLDRVLVLLSAEEAGTNLGIRLLQGPFTEFESPQI